VGFGLGSRNCIGQTLAKTEGKIALLRILNRYSEIEVLADKLSIKWKFLFVADEFYIKVKKPKQSK
jgi:cytochrome P450